MIRFATTNFCWGEKMFCFTLIYLIIIFQFFSKHLWGGQRKNALGTWLHLETLGAFDSSAMATQHDALAKNTREKAGLTIKNGDFRWTWSQPGNLWVSKTRVIDGHRHRFKLVLKPVPLCYTCYFFMPSQKTGAETRRKKTFTSFCPGSDTDSANADQPGPGLLIL